MSYQTIRAATCPARLLNLFSCVAALLMLSACGGGGDGDGSAVSGVRNPEYQAGVYEPSSTYQDHCAAPRSGTNDVRGSTTWENFWLRSWTHEFYLWYNEVPDLKPSDYSDKLTYFDLLKIPTDRFHFTYSTDEWEALSQSGVSPGYGVTWIILSENVPREVVVAYIQPGSPAAANTVTRGEEVLSVDGIGIDDVTQAGVDTLNEGLFPSALNRPHSFVLQALNGSQRTVNMTSGNITETPVLNYQSPGVIPTGSGNVGYLLFNDHFATAESELVTAINTLKQANINDLVLDLRYNGGGYLDIASEMAYMIAGNATTNGKIFEQAVFNDQYPQNLDPVTGQPNDPMPFFSTTRAGSALPSLNLNRVFVITGTGTCSASESIINSLRGVGVQVIQIGSTTCGKPYGFYPQDNCGTTYFSIEFQGVNDVNFGSYGNGFSPGNTFPVIDPNTLLPGCSVKDDFTHALGSTSESRLAAALFYRTAVDSQSNTLCADPPSGTGGRAQIQSVTQGTDLSAVDGQLNKGAWRENRIVRH